MLYAPYGALRYSSGTMQTTYGFTGQRSYAPSGLDYYGSRYYDPLAGQSRVATACCLAMATTPGASPGMPTYRAIPRTGRTLPDTST